MSIDTIYSKEELDYSNERAKTLESAISCLCNQLNNCQECSELFNMPNSFCCLNECHEHEFCRNCEKGIYSDNFKDWMDRYEDSDSGSVES